MALSNELFGEIEVVCEGMSPFLRSCVRSSRVSFLDGSEVCSGSALGGTSWSIRLASCSISGRESGLSGRQEGS